MYADEHKLNSALQLLHFQSTYLLKEIAYAPRHDYLVQFLIGVM